MDDLISRQDAIDAHCELCGDKDRCNCDICPDMEVFQLLPSAQPETMYYPQVDGVTPSVIVQPERKKGMWISDGDPATWVCSNCGYRVTGYNNTKFCPNCGADMRDE